MPNEPLGHAAGRRLAQGLDAAGTDVASRPVSSVPIHTGATRHTGVRFNRSAACGRSSVGTRPRWSRSPRASRTPLRRSPCTRAAGSKTSPAAPVRLVTPRRARARHALDGPVPIGVVRVQTGSTWPSYRTTPGQPAVNSRTCPKARSFTRSPWPAGPRHVRGPLRPDRACVRIASVLFMPCHVQQSRSAQT